MRKLFVVLILIITLLTGCGSQTPEGMTETVAKTDFSYGLWLSYTEIAALLKKPEIFKTEFQKVLDNCKTLDVENLYIHVRSHCDSIFPSDYFPLTDTAAGYDYDIFEYIIGECHKAEIKVHAWINPYRVSATTEDIETLEKSSPAYKWRADSETENDKNVLTYGGIYLNPAEFEARQLVINGIKEIITNYPVDGIHFDDYFYPTTDSKFDKESYELYCKSTENPLSLAEWRRACVDTLISGCKTAIKTAGKDIIFSISPAASIDTNYNTYYADIGGWIEKGYIDEIIPQLYFGFEHTDSDFRFENLLSDWKKLWGKNKKVKLTIGLAAYKIGTESTTDGTEWQENRDIMARQTEICLKDPDIGGVIYFSYSGLFSPDPQNTAERENLITALSPK